MSERFPPTPCPEIESIAALADGLLPTHERDAILQHVAGCDRCSELLAEVAHTQAALAPARPRSFRGPIIALIGIAATLLIGTIWFLSRTSSSEFTDRLVASVGPRRLTEARLTGGFAFGPLTSLTRSDAAPATDLAILTVAGQLRLEAARSRTAETLHAHGKALVLIGQYDEALKVLQEANTLRPNDGPITADLAAAWLTKALADRTSESAQRAFDAATSAAETAPGLPEAIFNKALAAELASRRDEAVSTWKRYLEVDSSSEWAAEARRHLSKL